MRFRAFFVYSRRIQWFWCKNCEFWSFFLQSSEFCISLYNDFAGWPLPTTTLRQSAGIPGLIRGHRTPPMQFVPRRLSVVFSSRERTKKVAVHSIDQRFCSWMLSVQHCSLWACGFDQSKHADRVLEILRMHFICAARPGYACSLLFTSSE